MRRAWLGWVTLTLACGDAGVASESSGGTTGSTDAESDSGEAPTTSSSSTGSTTTGDAPTTGDASTTSDATTGDEPEQPADCLIGDELQAAWTRSGDELPGFIGAVASTPWADTAIVGGIQSGIHSDVSVMLLDPAGATVWMDVYKGANGLDDVVLDVAVDGGGFLSVLIRERVFEVLGEDFASTDDRLVILRYAPDGAHVWRWERTREPVMPGGVYTPSGILGIVGDRTLLLEFTFDDPDVVITLDSAGEVLGETTIVDVPTLSVDKRAFGRGGEVYMAGNLDDGQGNHPLWIGGFAVDGSLAWFDISGGQIDRARALVAGKDGEIYVVRSTNKSGADEYRLQRYDSTGGSAWTGLLPVVGDDGSVGNAGLRCDGSPLVAGGIDRPAGPDLLWDNRVDLWLGSFAVDGAPGWTFEHEFGPPYSHGYAGRIAGVADGDVIVSGSRLDDEGSGSLPWLARLTPG